MEKKNKGFAISGILYPLMILCLCFVLMILTNLTQSKFQLNKLKGEIVDQVNGEDAKGLFKYEVNQMLNNIGSCTNYKIENGVLDPEFTYTGNTKDFNGRMYVMNDGRTAALVDNGVYCAYKLANYQSLRVQTSGTCETSILSNDCSGAGLICPKEDSITIKTGTSIEGVSGKKEDLFVKTNIPLPNTYPYQISLTEPSEKEEGTIWFMIDPSSNDEIKVNHLTLPINNCKQYIKGKWETKLLYYYQDKWNLISKDNSGANKPELVSKLIPVVYDGSNWVVADINKNWYNYDGQEWANAVILEKGITKKVGDTLNMTTEVAQMYVWIPRYEYQIPSESKGSTGTPNAIDIKFIPNTKTTPTSGYNIHPGFKFGTKELNGLWVGKFETTGNTAGTQTKFTCTNETCTEKVTIKPNYRSGYGKVSALFYASRSIKSQYGLTGVDTHMAKYTEWSTISYLTNSIYGRCNSKTSCMEITINDNSSYYTGGNDYISNTNQSTTGNITGVYDISGGQYEYVMGVLLESNEKPWSGQDSNSNSGFTGRVAIAEFDNYYNGLPFPDKKYYDTFTTSNSWYFDYSRLTAVNGVAGANRGVFKELMTTYTNTTNWYGDKSYFVSMNSPWFKLGGRYSDGTYAGVFNSYYDSGGANTSTGFRIILIVE